MTKRADLQDLLQQPSLLPESRLTLSPDGSFVAFVVSNPSKDLPRLPRFTPPIYTFAELHVVDVASGRIVLPMEAARSWAPSWSPDGSRLAFYSDASGMVRVHVWDPATGMDRQVNSEPARGFGYSTDYPRWIDDHTICVPLLPQTDAFEGYQTAPEPVIRKQAATREEVTAEELYWEGSNVPSRQEARSCTEKSVDPFYRARADIGLLDVESGVLKRIVTEMRAKLPYPSPNGKYIAFTTFGGRVSPKVSTWTEELWVIKWGAQSSPQRIAIGLSTGGEGRHAPAWSADGSELAFLKNGQIYLWSAHTGSTSSIDLGVFAGQVDEGFLLWSSDGQGFLIRRGRDLCYVLRDGRQLVLHIPESATIRGVVHRAGRTWAWSPEPGKCVVWTVDEESREHGFFLVPLDGGRSRRLGEDAKTLRAVSIAGHMMDLSQDGQTLVMGVESVHHPLRVYLADEKLKLKGPVNATRMDFEDPPLHEVLLQWQTQEGERRSGILLEPALGAGSAPVVVVIYPKLAHANHAHTWELGTAAAILPPQLLVQHGLAVFIPDLFPGKGAFLEKLHTEFEYALGAISRRSSVDISRVAVIGHSFGGYAVNCLITCCSRIKVAVSAAGCGDLARVWATFHSQQGAIDLYGCQWVETNPVGPQLQQTPWSNPKLYMRNSPVYRLDRVRAPLLLIGGADDPLYQPEEMLVGLTRLGKKVQCFRYRGEGHTPRDWRPANRLHVAERTVDWLKQHLGIDQ